MHLRRLLLASVLSLAVLSTGCYGSFAAVRTLHKWNLEVNDSRWVQTVVFWALVIVPVYEVFALSDGLVINAIEFWGDKNPMSDVDVKGPKIEFEGAVMFERDGKFYSLERLDADRAVIRLDGQAVGMLRQTEDGGFAFEDTLHHRSFAISPAELIALRRGLKLPLRAPSAVEQGDET